MGTMRDRLIACLFACCLALVASSALAQSFDDALANFAKDSFNDTEAGINAVATSGNPLAAEIIQALENSRLFFDPATGKIYIRQQSGRTLDASSGNAVNAPSDIKQVRINNRLRRSIEAAMGGLTLLSSDPKKRLEAAQAVFKSRDAALLPTLDAALAKETDSRIKRALGGARAAILLYKPDSSEAEKLDAISVLKERGDQEALATLAGLPATIPPRVLQSAKDGVTSIQNDLAMWATVQNAWYGLSLGSVLLLAAIGLAITFGVMGVINMAHGEMVMIGAYVTFAVQETIRIHNPALFDYSLFIAVPLAFMVSGSLGVCIER
jgi:urea transport system permease protein